ncbi:MAG: hypothetical protein L0H53_03965 [Candidatus Nitrosocosmicus sp.]|nr:hypothetical protein [Candidatus Nitrosocosmicus sp.]MDN5868129.1 hypothetical protein [Candidatus Nitrosocosmicus sp.]
MVYFLSAVAEVVTGLGRQTLLEMQEIAKILKLRLNNKETSDICDSHNSNYVNVTIIDRASYLMILATTIGILYYFMKGHYDELPNYGLVYIFGLMLVIANSGWAIMSSIIA